MRLPKIRQLTEEQKKVYLYAPTDKHVLVHGPPGTGKTLIACLRAVELQKKKVPVTLGMFNRVLAKYSSNAAEDGVMPSQTVMVWFREWWKASALPPHPNNPGKIAIQAPFEQNDLIKAAGGRWHPGEWRPWGGGKGAWVVDSEAYFADPGAFATWRLWHEPPVADGRKDGIDWAGVAKHILDHEECIPDAALELGTLLIDEGQDFPPGFYKTLRRISTLAAARGKRISHPPRCFVLADENQQLTEDNSTLQQIAETLKIPEENRYLLLDNFRNSKEIAELARSFFADVGVLPKLPERSSERPVLSLVGNHADVVQRIKVWVTNNPRKEVGILVFDDSARSSMTAALQQSLGRIRGRSMTIQTYSWRTRHENRAQDLLFDVPDVITVLNMQSCKGLEFDAVFVVDLHQAQIGIYGPDRFKMQMFVAVSRAREWVNLIDSGPRAGAGACFAHLPGPEFLERESEAVTTCTKRAAEQSASPRSAVLAQVKSDREVHGRQHAADRWFEELQNLAEKKALQVTDRRTSGGAIWVNGGIELAPLLKPLGLVYSQKRSGWWRK